MAREGEGGGLRGKKQHHRVQKGTCRKKKKKIASAEKLRAAAGRSDTIFEEEREEECPEGRDESAACKRDRHAIEDQGKGGIPLLRGTLQQANGKRINPT